ncbi:MAG: ribonuclease HII [Bacteroidales bacterium]|nr:ribonuclease HII [Candidatus Equimonas enterica]
MLRSIFNADGLVEAGCDEAGRGCLAGPVYAAAVILPPDYRNAALNDSKQLSARQRYALREEIERDALWALGVVSAEEIDRINILNASLLAMHRALAQLQPQPAFIIVDGNKFRPYFPCEAGHAADLSAYWMPHATLQPRVGDSPVPHATVVKGDGKYLSIAAASILAKTYRDDFMHEQHSRYPHYGWERNAGYPTEEHRAGLREHGLTPLHRRTFRLLDDAPRTFFD